MGQSAVDGATHRQLVLTGDKTLAYGLLLLATASLGAGFGLAVPALNTLTAAFHPDGIDRAILTLNALLGLGTVLAPLFVALFLGLGFWLGLPVTSTILLVALLLVSLRLPLRVGAPKAGAARSKTVIPTRFSIYAGFATLYGICETLNGNWSELDVTRELGGATSLSALTLMAFWAMVTLGRVLFASARRWFPPRLIYHLLPFLLAVAFVIIALLPKDEPALGVLAFALAGLGCSALLPLTISFGQEELSAIAAALTGGVIAFYQLGYGIAAFGVGAILDGGGKLSTIYAFGAVIAASMGALSVAVAGRRPKPAAALPKP